MSRESTIIVLESEHAIATDIKTRLERLGFQVIATPDSHEAALMSVAEHVPDLVLMDIALGTGRHGIETANEIRARFDTSVLWFIACADHETIERVQRPEPIALLDLNDETGLKANIELALSRYRSGSQARELLAKMFEVAVDGMIAVTSDGLIDRVNQRLLDLFGYDRHELVGQTMDVLVPEASRASHALHRTQYGAARTPRSMGDGHVHFVGSRKDGTRFPIDISLDTLELDGEILVVSTVRDITAQTQLQSQLDETRGQLKVLVEGAPDAIVVLDRAGRIQFINRVSPGRTVAEVIGTSWYGYMPAEQHTAIATALESVFTTGRPEIVELAASRGDGSLRWYASHLGPVLEQDAVSCVVVVGRDITELRNHEAQVREEQQRFRATFEQAAVGIAHVGLEHEVQRANSRLCELLGVTYADLIDRGLLGFVHAEDLDGARAAKDAVFAGALPAIGREERWISPSGPRWVNVTRSLIRDPDGKPQYIVVVVEDIEARKQAEQRFHEAQKLNALGQLAGGIAHDFNNMLSVILTCSELASYSMAAADPGRGDIAQIEQAAHRAADLTHQLLAFGRRQLLDPRIHDLTELVRSNEQIVRRLIREELELVLVLPAAPMRVRVDGGQFAQVLFNLVINARDAIVGCGTITIEIARATLDQTGEAGLGGLDAGAYVTLAVTDTGTGMDAETQARIFEPFFTTKELGKGTGLGLATVFGIVKQSGGGIFVDSELGRGSTFTVYLPASVELPAVTHRSTQPIEAGRGSGETILVVEDDAFVREAAAQVLRRGGYQVLEASSAGEALLIWETNAAAIHVILTDVVMPRLTGPQLVARLQRAQAPAKVLYMSGYAQDVVSQHHHLGAGVEFLCKPLTAKALLGKVRSMLDG